MKLLLILTVADIRAVGPDVWNGWKGQLLRTLYHEPSRCFQAATPTIPRGQLVANAQSALREALGEWPRAEVERFIDRHYPDYWMRADLKRQVYHARLLRRAEAEGTPPRRRFHDRRVHRITELTVFAPNHPRLLSMFAGACAAKRRQHSRCSYHDDARGFALDTFLLAREFSDDEDETRRARRIETTIEKLLRGEARTSTLLEKAEPCPRYRSIHRPA